MNFDYLNTKRLKLRILDQEAYSYIHEHLSENELKLFLGIQTEEEWLREKLKFEKGMTTFNRTFLLFQIIEKSSGNVIGGCGYHNWIAEHSRAEIGYALNNDVYKQKGYMSEALNDVIAYGFNKMNLNRIEAFVGPNNQASLNLVEKFNFIKEGIMREHYCKNNMIGDSVVYSLLKSEYIKSLDDKTPNI